MLIVFIAKLSKILTRKSDDFVSTCQSIRLQIFVGEDRLVSNSYACVLGRYYDDLATIVEDTSLVGTRLNLISSVAVC